MTAMIQSNRTSSVHLLYISETFLSESLWVKGEEYRRIFNPYIISWECCGVYEECCGVVVVVYNKNVVVK